MPSALTEDQLCRSIMAESSDAIMFADRRGIIRLWNKGAERMFGHLAAEVLGESLDVIIPENLRERHWEGYYRVMESGSSHYSIDLLSAPALRKDGTRLSTEFSMVLLKDADGVVLGVAAIIRDVSARWQKEKELKERVRVLESQQAG